MMNAVIYLRDPKTGKAGEELARLNLDVVPRGTYIINGTEYRFNEAPIFHIVKNECGTSYEVSNMYQVDLIVDAVRKIDDSDLL